MSQVVDPRTKLAFLLLSNVFLFAEVPLVVEVSFLSFCWLLLLWQRDYRFVGVTVLLYGLVGLAGKMIGTGNGVLAIWMSFLIVMVQKFFPMILAARFVTATTALGAWQEALQRLRCPQILITALTMLIRFFPVLIEDMKQIWQALGFRGLRPRLGSFLRHPFQLFEYLFVPLLHMANETALEMSASVLTRGMTVNGRKTSYQPIGFSWRDGLASLFLLSFIWLIVKG